MTQTRPKVDAPEQLGEFASPIQLDSVTRSLAVLAIASYVAGLIVVNFFLVDFGTSEFGLLRPRFVLSGAVALLPVVITVIPYFAIWSTFREWQLIPTEQRGGRWSIPVKVAFALAIGVASLLFLVLAIWFATGINSFRSALRLAVLNQLPILSFLLIIASVRGVWERAMKEGWQRLALGFGEAFWAMVFVFMYLHTFSSTLYPLIPEQAGGGLPVDAQLVFRENTTIIATNAGIELVDDRLISTPVKIFWDDGELYIIGVPHSDRTTIVQIDKDVIDAVVIGDDTPPVASPTGAPAVTKSSQLSMPGP